MRNFTDRFATALPWLGILLLAAGAVSYFITRRFDLLTNAPLAAGTILILLFAVLRPDDVRQFFGTRQARYGTTTVLSIVFFAAIAIILYWITFQNDDWRVDVTETNEFTPLPETIELLKDLDQPVHVIGFYTNRSAARQDSAQSTLDSLAAVNSDFSYEFVDPEENPLLAERYELNSDGTLVFVKGEGENEVFAKSTTTSDRDIHSALLHVINPREKKVYFLTGHGERGTDDFTPAGMGNIVGDLDDLGFTVEELSLAVTGQVPDDADVVALVDQQAPLQEGEVEALAQYLDGGGAAFVARDFFGASQARIRVEDDGLNAMLLDDWGIRLQRDLIVEPQFGLAGQQVPLRFVSFDFSSSPITPADLENLGALFNLARSVDSQDTDGVTHVDLVMTSAPAWGETNFEVLPQPDDADFPGPLAVGISAESSQSGGRLVVFGDADFVGNDLVYVGGNNLLFTNALNWLAGDETTLELTPRETINRQVTIPQTQLGMLQVLSWFGGPLLMAVIGGVIWFTRRQSR